MSEKLIFKSAGWQWMTLLAALFCVVHGFVLQIFSLQILHFFHGPYWVQFVSQFLIVVFEGAAVFATTYPSSIKLSSSGLEIPIQSSNFGFPTTGGEEEVLVMLLILPLSFLGNYLQRFHRVPWEAIESIAETRWPRCFGRSLRLTWTPPPPEPDTDQAYIPKIPKKRSDLIWLSQKDWERFFSAVSEVTPSTHPLQIFFNKP